MVLQLFAAEDFFCRHCVDKEAFQIMHKMDQLYSALTNGQSVVLLFEYLGPEGYGCGIFYAPHPWNRIRKDEAEVLLFIGNPGVTSAFRAATGYLGRLIKELSLHRMPTTSRNTGKK